MMGGLLGSSHCIGMCGGFAAIVGMRSGSVAANFRNQIVYSTGRMTSYATLGGIAGFAGNRMAKEMPTFVNVPALLCLIAGVFLVREGLFASGLLQRRQISGTSTSGCLIRPLFTSILRKPGTFNTFLAGTATGLLPCGLVYSFVSLAASSADLLQGAATMLQFGCGTVPLMVLTGCGTALISYSARQRVWQVAGWSVLLTGLLTLVRGAAFLQWETPSDSKPIECPFCRVSTTNVDTVPETQPQK
jgi:sulfite exporter TauE/SafE